MLAHSTSGGPSQLKISRMRAICTRMSRPLFALMIAVAMLFASLATFGASAMALTHADHHAQRADSGHCGGQPASSDHDKAPDKPCCVAMCAAVAVAPIASIEPRGFSRPIERSAAERFQRSFLAELPTPPPRLA